MNIQNLIRPSIKVLQPYSSARDEFNGIKNDLIFLDANENPFENGVNRYPDPQQVDLKTRLSQIKSVPAENMVLGNGSDEILDLLIRMFCEPNVDNIVVLPPTYGMYEVLANINAVKTLKINLKEENFQPDLKAIVTESDVNSKLLFLCSPNNPTGNNLDNVAIEFLLQKFKGIVVIDEAYIDFSGTKSWTHRLQEFPNLVVTQTLSKAYGMAGIRLGICYASKEIVDTINKMKPPYNVNSLTQERALEYLRFPEKVQTQIETLLTERKKLINCLSDISFIEKIYPSDANFVLIKVDDANRRYQELVDNGIVIRNRTKQPLCGNCLRLTIGTPKENTQLIKIFKSI